MDGDPATTSSGNAYRVDAKPKGESALEEVRRELDELDAVVSHLEVRLMPALEPEPEVPGPTVAELRAPMSEVRALTLRIDGIRRRLTGITGRVDL